MAPTERYGGIIISHIVISPFSVKIQQITWTHFSTAMSEKMCINNYIPEGNDVIVGYLNIYLSWLALLSEYSRFNSYLGQLTLHRG